jgi:hypothetical protein
VFNFSVTGLVPNSHFRTRFENRVGATLVLHRSDVTFSGGGFNQGKILLTQGSHYRLAWRAMCWFGNLEASVTGPGTLHLDNRLLPRAVGFPGYPWLVVFLSPTQKTLPPTQGVYQWFLELRAEQPAFASSTLTVPSLQADSGAYSDMRLFDNSTLAITNTFDYAMGYTSGGALAVSSVVRALGSRVNVCGLWSSFV